MMRKVAAIIPAWNEASTIAESIRSIFRQDYPLDIVIVSADNCTDNTVKVVEALKSTYPNLYVMKTINNKARKSGALNQAIYRLPHAIDYIFVLDADTKAHKNVVGEGVRLLNNYPRLAAACARTHLNALPDNTPFTQKVWWHLQRLEYATADSGRVEKLDNIKILAGSCVVYRREALQEVAEYRGNGQFYDEASLIEDYELTLTFKELGWRVTIGMGMDSWTNVPLSFKVHWQQRIRWARSHVDTLRQKGWNPITRGDILGHTTFVILWPQQLFFLGLLLYLFSTGVTFTWNPLLWVFLGLNWANRMYRLRYVPRLNYIDVLIRAAFVPEEVYGIWHSIQRTYAYYLAYVNGPEEWHLT